MNEPSLRSVAKRAMLAVSLVLTSPLILLAWLERKSSRKDGLFVSLGQLLSLIPGKVGSYLRSAYYFGSLEASSWEVHIGFGTYFSHRAARLGSHVAIGSYCVIGTVSIGDDVMIASRVSITSGKRQHFDDNGSVSMEPRFDRVTVGPRTWVGEGAIVLADVGPQCIVSAGAVVMGEIPAGQLAGGNPAKVLKSLDELRCSRAER